MKVRIIRLFAAASIIAVLMLSQVCAGFASWDDPIICVTKDLIDGKYAFKVQRVKDASTGEIPNDTEITFTYRIRCETDTNETLKTAEGSSGIPAGKNDVLIDVAELVEEMRAEVVKYRSISVLCTLKNVKGANLGTIDQIIINNTADMPEEDVKALQKAFGEMFENMEKKSGSTGISDNDAKSVQTGTPVFKGASGWAAAELEKAAGYGFITDRIKDNMSAPITREEFAEVAVRLYEKYTGKQADIEDMSVFSDTTNPEIFKAYNLKIVNGTNAAQKLFSPKASTSRQQVAAMLLRTLSAMKPGADLDTTGASSFTDEKDIAPWAIEAMRFMNKNGFLKGSGSKIDPNGICTREMAVLIAARVYEKYSVSAPDSGMND
ncbi:MAG TPA: S-layer homology domain-containing protein [Clostridia bacterium]|nr:S-layer homology domain-containing protein [Clostridia bacterium]